MKIRWEENEERNETHYGDATVNTWKIWVYRWVGIFSWYAMQQHKANVLELG